MKKKKIILVAGARPNFIKIAPVLKEMKGRFTNVLVHTRQHYHQLMSKVFFNDLEIRAPDYLMGAATGTHSQQTAKTMVEFEKICLVERPDLVIVAGDVNSTLACSISAKKLNIPVAHIEAGLRSHDLMMPEELNRIMTDSISDFLFATEESGVRNLQKEGRRMDRVFLVGNTMIDSLIFGLEKLRRMDGGRFRAARLKTKLRKYGVVTLHRPGNVDGEKKIRRIFGVLNRISGKIPLVFPVHPRTRHSLMNFRVPVAGNIHLLAPLGYLEFLFLHKNAEFILTDSGGLQEEATFLRVFCFTMRETTERPATIEHGSNTLVGDNYAMLLDSVVDILQGRKDRKDSVPPLWDGRAAERIVSTLEKVL